MVIRLCFLLILTNYFCNGFNFDTNFPIVYSDPQAGIRTSSNKSSYFGYSILMYSGNNGTQPWIQVGSPRGEDPNIRVSNPGVVFRCNIFKECKVVTVDRDVVDDYNNNGFRYKVNKTDAWIGGTMDILPEADLLVVCGFRWNGQAQYYEDNFMVGCCYLSKINDRNFYRKVTPLLDKDKLIRRSAIYFLLGQIGISAELVMSKHGPVLHAGAPGVEHWAGTSVLINNLSAVYTSANIPKIISGIGALQGYAVTSGYYFGKQELLYASSSPKQNQYLGQILVFAFQTRTDMELDVRDSKQGSQVGEYFGAALASGDINSDGYTDLLVGAPFYKARQYNEGRVYIFHGGTKALIIPPEGGQYLVGSAPGGQFGTSIAYLGDFDFDGYGDFAVGAPYEEEKSGVIYIFRGSANGLISEPSQIIRGKSLNYHIKGFGISFSKPTDIDRNGYKDLAVGAYLSGHAVILRAKPEVKLKQSLKVWGDRVMLSRTVMEVCLWFEGSFLPKFIMVNRTITLDINYGRLIFENPKDAFKQETLENGRRSCRNYTIFLKEAVSDLEHPVNIQISQKMAQENRTNAAFIVGISKRDTFCSMCPVMGPYTPFNADVSFDLQCDDDVCKSNLSFHTVFSNVTNSRSYVIGSTEYITMTTQVSNSGEKAYSTILIFKLPENVYIAFTPKFCRDGKSSDIIICVVANPLENNEIKEISLKLNMNGILSGTRRRKISFTVIIKTSSQNLNTVQRKDFDLPLINEADILLTGKSNQLRYSYRNVKNGLNSTFSQIFEIQKFGKSPVDEVILHMNIPVSIKTSTDEIKFLKFHHLVGLLSGQPIICKNLTYVEYVNELYEDDTSSIKILNEESPRMLLKRSTNFNDLVITNNLTGIGVNKTENGNLVSVSNNTYFPSTNTFVIDCNEANTRCVTFRCAAGPFRSEPDVGVIQMKAYLDVSALKDILGIRTQIILFTRANISVENFLQSGNKSDDATVITIFEGELTSAPVPVWIVILTIIVGFILLLILTLGLHKAGFFKREKKLELKALKKHKIEGEFLDAAAKADPNAEDNKGGELGEIPML